VTQDSASASRNRVVVTEADDLTCWLHAAFRPRPDGTLDVARIATGLGVSPSTVRRWRDGTSASWPAPQHWSAIRRRAILRGRGSYLWPTPSPAALRRTQRAQENAQRDLLHAQQLDDRALPAAWKREGWLEPQRLRLVYYPQAHVYQLSITRERDRPADRISRVVEKFEMQSSIVMPTWHAAVVARCRILHRMSKYRCVAPRELVEVGRTEVWVGRSPFVELS
jgi:hypothetical protein